MSSDDYHDGLPSEGVSDLLIPLPMISLRSNSKQPCDLIIRELVRSTYHQKLKEAITVLLAALKFNNKAVAQVPPLSPPHS